MAEAFIALGGNVGDVRTTFARAIAMVCERAPARLLARSADYRTPPWGVAAQADFINACIALDTACPPHDLLAHLHAVERAFGRDRTREIRNGPRTLDLDLLIYDALTLEGPPLTLPHPRLMQRAFVLMPLADIAPDRHVGGVTVRDALAGLSVDGIERLPAQPIAT